MKDDIVKGELEDNNFISVLIALVIIDKLNIVDFEVKAIWSSLWSNYFYQ